MTPAKQVPLDKRYVVILMMLLVVGWFYFLSYKQYESGLARGDFAAIWQALHNWSFNGGPWSSYNLSVHEYVGMADIEKIIHYNKDLDSAHQFGIHAHFLLYPLSFFSRIFTSPLFLLFVQALVYGGFVFFLGLRGIKKEIGIIPLIALLASFTVSPFSLGLILNDFHFDSFAAISIGLFILLVQEDNPKWCWLLLWAVGTASVKESFVALVVGGGLYLLFSGKKNISKGIALVIIGTGLFVFLTRYFIPHYSPNHSFMFSSIYGSRLGYSLGEIIVNSIKSPYIFWREITLGVNKAYLLSLSFACPLFFLFAPRALLLGSGFLFINLVTSNNAMKIPWGQYSVVFVCGMHLASVDGYSKLSEILFKSRRIIGYVIIFALFSLTFCFAYKATPLKHQIWASFFRQGEYSMIRSLPSTAKICADDRMANYVADRRSLYLFPLKLDSCDYVILSADRPSYLNDERWNFVKAFMQERFDPVIKRPGLVLLKRRKLNDS